LIIIVSFFTVEVEFANLSFSDLEKIVQSYQDYESKLMNELSNFSFCLAWETAYVRPLLDNMAPTAFADLRLVGLPFSQNKPIIWSYETFHNVLARAVGVIHELMNEEFTLQRGLKSLGEEEVVNGDDLIPTDGMKTIRIKKEKKRADGIKNSGLYRLQVLAFFFFLFWV
jgi:hypothetical protein